MALPGLVVDVEARITKLERALDRANKLQSDTANRMERRARQSADRMSDSYGRAGASIGKMFSRLGPALAGGAALAGVATLTRGIREATRATAELGAMASRAGVGVESFQSLKFAAEQSKVGVDALADGMKEMSLRADEFIETGGGSAAESFRRLGYDAATLSRKLADPADLFAELIGRLQQLDVAAQIRVADEIFGGTGGEQFLQLIGRGESALRGLMQKARDTGAVLDSATVESAQEIDAKFAALEARAGAYLRRVAVNAAEAIEKLATLREDLDDILPDDQARNLLGDGAFDALEDDSAAVAAHKEAITALIGEYQRLGDETVGLDYGLNQAALSMMAMGRADLGRTLADAATEARALRDGLEDGTVSADDFEVQLGATLSTAAAALGELDAIDRAQFGGVIASLGGLIERLGAAAARARELRASLPGASPDGGTTPKVYSGRGGDPRTMGDTTLDRGLATATENAPRSIPRPQAAPLDIDFGMRPEPVATSGGGGGGGSRSGGGGGGAARRETDLQREIAAITEETAALRLEAAELAKVTGAQGDYAQAVEIARTKAELLAAAQQSNASLTPQLKAQIDDLAKSYVMASTEAERAATRIEEIQNAAQDGASRMANMFEGMATGALSAKDAVGQLIIEMLKLSLKKRFMAMAMQSTGPAQLLFQTLGMGFESGGFTGKGHANDVAGLVHRGEYVLSKPATDAIGVANLDALHTVAKKGYRDGGLVGRMSGSAIGSDGKPSVSSAPQITINAPVTVNATGGSNAQNADLARQVSREMEASMRTTIADELRKQMRPGNMLRR